MSLESKLSRWQQAGVIDADTRARIEAFEHQNARPMLLYALGGLGATTIGIGIVSIVAANWDAIGKPLKLGIDLLIVALLAGAIYLSAARQRLWQTEVFVGIQYIAVIASLALVGQVYQLGSPTHHALLAWSLSTLPMMLLVRTPLLAFTWLAGLIWTHIDTTVFYLERLDASLDYGSDPVVANVAASVVSVSAVAYLCAARLPWLVRERPAVSATWTRSLWMATLWGALSMAFLFYVDLERDDRLSWSALVGALSLGGFAWSLPRLYPTWNPRVVLGARMLLGAIWITFMLSAVIAHPALPAAGACAQVVILAIAAWTVLQLGLVRTFNSFTGLIALRVLFMYFEVFGSMLDTGLGMISGGMLTLLLAWVWKRKSPELAARFATGGHDHAA